MTNAAWRETQKPKPKAGERLFQLDGYFPSGTHKTYGMHYPEPNYDAVKEMVTKIVQNERVESIRPR